MIWNRYAVVLLVGMLMGPISRAAVPDSVIDAAAEQYQKLLSDSREAGDRPGMGDMGDFVDKAFSGISIEQLSIDQVQKALNSAPIPYSTKVAKAVDGYLTTLAANNDLSGARAAILKIQLIPINADNKDLEKLTRLKAALAHPAIATALSSGYGAMIFEAASNLDADTLKSVAEPMLKLKDSVGPEGSVGFYQQAGRFFMAIVRTLGPEGAQQFAPLRESVAAAAQAKLAGTSDASAQNDLNQALSQMTSAYVRGELVGHPAPEIDFIWFTDPSNPDRKPVKLSDLKGKVVVLDFWATWCGPCIASFPKVKAVQRYYRGYEVIVVGVTSIQGSHSGANGRINTQGDPQKEMDLMPGFMTEKDMSWAVAFSKQPVFNADYGVMGIPSMAIIDTKGIVRYVGLHPGAGTLEDKTSKIDKLLAEGGKPIPATMIQMTKPLNADK